jgi:predicted ATP-dependent endonuclease of OLD family
LSKILKLDIKNFRGIKSLSETFDKNFVCLIGRGDSGKTTILDSIYYVLCPSYALQFYDTDFFNGDVTQSIEIETTLTDLSDVLQTEDKFGLYKRQYDKNTGIVTDEIVENPDLVDVYTIRLTVDNTLEPKWEIITGRQEPKPISATDRAKLNCSFVSDYVDRHFSWNKGTPLYQLLEGLSQEVDNKNVIIEKLRQVKNEIDDTDFPQTLDATNEVKKYANLLGLNVDGIKTSIDFRDIAIKDDKVCINDNNNIPFRLRGKGSKRIVSMAIQLALAKQGGIILIDEVEQGLEPDRIKQIVSALKTENGGQIFITTHSRDAIVELNSDDLFLVKKADNTESVSITNIPATDNWQAIVRGNPEGFFCKKIIVCEGKTEIGICRALDNWRKNQNLPSMSAKDCFYILGEGSSIVDRAKKIKELGFDTCAFLDSDRQDVNDKKPELTGLGIKLFDCEKGKDIEHQIFNDLPWYTVEALISTRDCSSLGNLSDCAVDRDRIANLATVAEKEWYKRIDKGEALGGVMFNDWNTISDCHTKRTLTTLSEWIDA